MPSKTSFFNSALFRGNWKRFWPLLAVYAFVYLIIIFLFNQQIGRSGAYMVDDIGEAAVIFGNIMQFMSGPIAALAMFQWLWHPASSDFHHSLPVRREGLFITSYVSGLFMLVLPQLFTALCFALIEIVHVEVNFPELALGLWNTFSLTVFYYSLASFCAVISGHIVSLFVFYGLLNFLYVIMQGIIASYLPGLVFGFEYRSSFSTLLSPFIEIFSRQSDISRAYPYIFMLFVSGVLLAAGAALIMRRRRVETAGEVVVIRWLRPVFKYTITFLAAALGSILFQGIFGVSYIPLLYEIIFASLAYFICEMLLQKSVKIFKRSFKGYVIFVAAMYLLLIAVAFDITGYESFVPPAGQVEAISVYSDGNGYYYSSNVDPLRDGTSPGVYREIPNIENGLSLHKWITENKFTINGGLNVPMGIRLYSGRSFHIRYLMKNGSVIERTYHLPHNYTEDSRFSLLSDSFRALVNSTENIEHCLAPFNNFSVDFIVGAQVWPQFVPEEVAGSYKYPVEHRYISDQQTCVRLYEALAEDARSGRVDFSGLRRDTESFNIDFEYSSQDDRFPGDTRLLGISFSIDKNASLTMAVLESLPRDTGSLR